MVKRVSSMGQLLVDLFFMRDARLTFEFTPDRRGVRKRTADGGQGGTFWCV